jgi:hypothetical protein
VFTGSFATTTHQRVSSFVSVEDFGFGLALVFATVSYVELTL